jgi:S1-C subfamily serine protease
MGTYGAVVPGEDLLILGYPLRSEDLMATSATVAAKIRTASHRNAIVTLDAIELDGAVNIGNSGGPALSLDREEVVGIVSVRYGNIGTMVEDLRRQLTGAAPPGLAEILDILDLSNDYLNPGLGRAISTGYVVSELRRLNVL